MKSTFQIPNLHNRQENSKINKISGIVGKDLTIEDGKRAARICALNVLSVIKAELDDLDRVKQFVQIWNG